MNRLVSFIICVVVVSLVGMCNIQAQSKKWTLTECIEYAVKHNIEVKQSDNQIQSLKVQKNISSNPQPIGFSGILLAKRQNSFYCTYFLHNRNVADTKSPYPIKRLEVIRWFNQKSMVFNQSLS